MNDMRCKIPPRGSGHPGPCAALKIFNDAKPEASSVTREQEVGWALKALKQWEQDTESPASVTESNAFIDGFMEGLRAGREEKS